MSDLLINNLCLVIPTLLCLTPLVLVVGAALFFRQTGRKWIDRLLLPNPQKVQTQYRHLATQHPDLDRDALVQILVEQAAFRCGVLGGLAAIGGVGTAIMGMPLDLLMSMRTQAGLLYLIYSVYAPQREGAAGVNGAAIGEADEETAALRTYALMAGSKEVTTVAFNLVSQVALRFIGQSILKSIPLIGAVAGYFVNYWYIRGSARFAIAYCKGEVNRQSLVKVVQRSASELQCQLTVSPTRPRVVSIEPGHREPLALLPEHATTADISATIDSATTDNFRKSCSPVLLPEEVAEQLRISLDEVQELIATGTLASKRIGSQIRIPRHVPAQFLAG